MSPFALLREWPEKLIAKYQNSLAKIQKYSGEVSDSVWSHLDVNFLLTFSVLMESDTDLDPKWLVGFTFDSLGEYSGFNAPLAFPFKREICHFVPPVIVGAVIVNPSRLEVIGL